MRRLLIVALLLVLPGRALAAGRMVWWNTKWEYRRTVQAYATPSGFPGDDVAWVSFTGGGQVKPDGSDVRVVADKDLVPSKVLFVGRGDQVTVAFKVIPNVAYYEIYFGNESADPPKEDWQIRRGCLLETREYNGGDPKDWGGMQDILKRANRVMGRAFVEKVFLGHNPFGPSVNNVNIYTGALVCPKAGNYTFYTTSDDASFLLVDGKMVVQWPGWHGAVRDARHKGQVDLTQGLHKLEYYHVQAGGSQYAVAAWQVPGSGTITVIPNTSFAPVQRAQLGYYQTRSQRGGMADFWAENAGEALLEESDNYLIRMKFDNRTSAGVRASGRCEWDFGDGNTLRAISPEHIYFSRGTYTVRLWAGKKTNVFEAKVVVDRDWWRGVLDQNIDKVEDYLPMVAKYEWGQMPGDDLRNAVIFFERLGKKDRVLELCNILLDVTRELSDDRRLEIAGKVADLYRERGESGEAARTLQLAADRAAKDAVKAELLVRAGDIQYEDLRDAEAAMRSFDAAVRDHAAVGGMLIRRAYIGLGDAARLGLRQEGEKAQKEALAFYEKALAVKYENTTLRRDQLLVAAAGRAVEDYLRRDELDTAWSYLESWRLRSPLDMLTGNWIVLYARYLIARGKIEPALDELALLLEVTPRNNYAPEALVVKAEAWLRLKKPERAREALEDLADDYPESALAERTEEIFAELQKKVAPPPAPKKQEKGKRKE